MVREGQKIKAEREAAEAEKNGGVLPNKKIVSTDHKKFTTDGSISDEKKLEKDMGVGSHIVNVDRAKKLDNKSPFSGETIVDVKESDVVREARERRWGNKSHDGKNRVLSQNAPKVKDDLPIPPTAEQLKDLKAAGFDPDVDIFGQEDLVEMSKEAQQEAEIEKYYTMTADPDSANFEKNGVKNGGQSNAAASMDIKMAAELSELRMKEARETEKRIFEAEKEQYARDQFEFGVTPMPPAPPDASQEDVLEKKRQMMAKDDGKERVGVGGSWPAKATSTAGNTTNYEELD